MVINNRIWFSFLTTIDCSGDFIINPNRPWGHGGFFFGGGVAMHPFGGIFSNLIAKSKISLINLKFQKIHQKFKEMHLDHASSLKDDFKNSAQVDYYSQH